jgi:hypothetical protein
MSYTKIVIVIENTTFRKLDLFPPSGEGKEIHALLGPLEGSNINHWTSGLDTFFLILDDGQIPQTH